MIFALTGSLIFEILGSKSPEQRRSKLTNEISNFKLYICPGFLTNAIVFSQLPVKETETLK